MKNNMKYILLVVGIIMVSIIACKKTEYSFGNIQTPSNIVINTAIQGSNTANPTGDGSGNVNFTVSATNAITYKIYFGNGDSVLTPTGTVSYKYTTIDTNTYTVTVNAIGTAGTISTLSQQIKVLYKYQIPSTILADLTNGSSKTWAIAKDTVGHLGVGPANTFTPDYYTAQPNEKPSCAYGSVITFSQVGTNGISINDNNNGSTFVINDANSFYSVSGGDGCYPIVTVGAKTLGFTSATSGSSSSNSTGVQFTVPGNGVVGFGLGGTVYEILYISPKVIWLRNICRGDGLAWYQILRAQ